MSKHDEFFSAVTKGDPRFQPKFSWSPMIPVHASISGMFSLFQGDFDRHIATSIPLYRELQLKQVEALIELYVNRSPDTAHLLYDIAGSGGSWIKTLCEFGWNFAVNIDCNADMKKLFNFRPSTRGVAVFAHNSFLADVNGVTAFVPPAKADVVHAGMAFQFMPYSIESCLKEVKDLYIKPRGLFLIEAKVKQENEAEWVANERLKDLFKSRYYTEEQLSLKGDAVLKDMHNNLITRDHLVTALHNKFNYVKKYYQAGNFIGYACSDCSDTAFKFINKIGNIQL